MPNSIPVIRQGAIVAAPGDGALDDWAAVGVVLVGLAAQLTWSLHLRLGAPGKGIKATNLLKASCVFFGTDVQEIEVKT